MKKRLTQSEEFEILKLVLDKVLWMGFGIMGYGFYLLVSGKTDVLVNGVYALIGGTLMLMLVMWLLIREYEIVK